MEIYYEGELIDAVRAEEIQVLQAEQTRRSAQINCHVDLPARRRGKSWALAMLALGAGCGFGALDTPVLRREATRPVKHWVARKDWTQRQKRRPRR